MNVADFNLLRANFGIVGPGIPWARGWGSALSARSWTKVLFTIRTFVPGRIYRAC